MTVLSKVDSSPGHLVPGGISGCSLLLHSLKSPRKPLPCRSFCTQLTEKKLIACPQPASLRHLTANPAGQCGVGRTLGRSRLKNSQVAALFPETKELGCGEANSAGFPFASFRSLIQRFSGPFSFAMLTNSTDYS